MLLNLIPLHKPCEKSLLYLLVKKLLTGLMSVDGCFIYMVGGEWKEVKTVVKEPVAERGEQVVHTRKLTYFSRMSEAGQFQQAALVEIHERGMEQAETVCAVSDGAEWISTFVDYHRADAVRILYAGPCHGGR